MNPVNFPEKNTIFGKPESMTDEECSPLPVFSQENLKISCWELTNPEILYLIFFRKIWLTVHLNIQPPVSLQVETPFVRQENGLEDIEETIKLHLKRKVKQFCERRWVKPDLDSGIMIHDADQMETLLLNFVVSAFDLKE